MFQLKIDKDGHSYFATLEIKNVTVEDAGKYKVTAKNELGESNATISLNFDSKSSMSLRLAPPHSLICWTFCLLKGTLSGALTRF